MVLLLILLSCRVLLLLAIRNFLLPYVLLQVPRTFILWSLSVAQPESFTFEDRHVLWALASYPIRTVLRRRVRRVAHLWRLLVDALARGAVLLTLFDGDHGLEV